MECCLVAALLLSAPSQAQISDKVQSRLETMAVERLENATTIQGIAKAAEVLSSLNKVSESTRVSTCKRVAKLLVSETSTLPSLVYPKAQIYRYFNCE